MYADGLTKGSVLREALHQLMEGQMELTKDRLGWSTKKIIPNYPNAQNTGQRAGFWEEHSAFLADISEAFAGQALITKLSPEYHLKSIFFLQKYVMDGTCQVHWALESGDK